MTVSDERDRELAFEVRELTFEVFFGESVDWYQNAVRIIRMARAEEREACARIADELWYTDESSGCVATLIAEKIRSRK